MKRLVTYNHSVLAQPLGGGRAIKTYPLLKQDEPPPPEGDPPQDDVLSDSEVPEVQED
jgi:hypothetical protein